MSFIKRTARLSLSDGTQVDLTDEDSYKNAVKKINQLNDKPNSNGKVDTDLNSKINSIRSSVINVTPEQLITKKSVIRSLAEYFKSI